MAALLALALLTDLGDLPRTLGEPLQEEKGAAPKGTAQVFAVEAFVLTTSFDEGIRLDDGVGGGVDFNFRWQYNGKTRMGFSVGVAGWDTETDIDFVPDQDVDIVQYRFGFGAEFPFSKVEIGLGVTAGVYRYRADDDADTSPYLEFEASLGFRPVPMLKIGGMLLASHTQSSFARSHTHLFHHYSAGLGVEVGF